jgi:SAM-dependent methyltransferase
MHLNENSLSGSKLQDLGRWYIIYFEEKVAKEFASGATDLHAGAGKCVYKRYFSHCDYKAIDLTIEEDRWNYQALDYVASLHDMPIKDNTYDAILCTQVLDHLEWPRESVAEMYRVLEPGGKLFLTVPLAHPEHQVPYDFFRHTSFGLRSICAGARLRTFRLCRMEASGQGGPMNFPHLCAPFPVLGPEAAISASRDFLCP